MKHRAEIFDQVQYLFDTTGFNDHQLHAVIRFKGKVDAEAMGKSFRLLVKCVPMLSRVYRNRGCNSCWVDGVTDYRELFTVTRSSGVFDRFTFSKTNEEKGPQIKGCLLQSESDALSIVMNHMICDGAGMKECLYLLSRIYSNVVKDPFYKPDFIIDGDRSLKQVLSAFSLGDRCRAFFFRGRDNNSAGRYALPLSSVKDVEPFILARVLPASKYARITGFCRHNQVTVNDMVMAAYFRVLSDMLCLDGDTFGLSFMIDMRRHLKDKRFTALLNLASMATLRLAAVPGEAFPDTLARISAGMKAKKGSCFGLNSFVKLSTLYALCGQKTAYRLIRDHMENPNICMTNIGVLDSERLVFEGTETENAYITGSIKYRPHFQMSLSTYGEQITLAVNLYGNNEDRVVIEDFFNRMERELDAATATAPFAHTQKTPASYRQTVCPEKPLRACSR